LDKKEEHRKCFLCVEKQSRFYYDKWGTWL